MEKAPKIKTPEETEDSFGELADEARKFFIKQFPEYSSLVDSQEGRKIVDRFVGDVLTHHDINNASVFHRLKLAQQKEALQGKHIEDLFQNLSPELLTFYRRKFEELL